jgi:hypothetical protein
VLVERARLAGGVIYEVAWPTDVEARFDRLTAVVPPPPGPLPFHVGETTRYTVSWDGAGVNLSAGEITLAVEDAQAAAAPGSRYRLVATAATAPWVARFFEARDRFATTVDAGLMPLVHEREQHEGARHVVRAYVYDGAAKRVLSGRTVADARMPGALALPLIEQARDPLAALYYVRTLPLARGDVIEIPVNDAGRNLIVEVRSAGEESIVVSGRRLQAIRLEPRLRQRLDRRQPVTGVIWVSADERRMPLRVDVSAAFGRVTLERLEAGS